MKKVGDIVTVMIGTYVSIQGDLVRLLVDGWAEVRLGSQTVIGRLVTA